MQLVNKNRPSPNRFKKLQSRRRNRPTPNSFARWKAAGNTVKSTETTLKIP
jgi:hypothetical protein